MRNLITTFLLLLVTLGLNAQVVPSDCTVPEELIQYYDWDIKGLAVTRMLETNHPDKDKVHIPQIIQDSIAEGLAAILNAGVLPQRDSIFNLYCIHDNTTQPITMGIIVKIDDSYSWTTNWQNNITTTGEPLMDYMIDLYGLEISNYLSVSKLAILQTTNLWNISALSDSLALVDGVTYAEGDFIIGNAGKIIYDLGSDGVKHYEFSLEWNDCFDGCDNRHTWFYEVQEDCTVEFTGTYDFGFFGIEPLPAPVNCDDLILDATDLLYPKYHYSIFPNPVEDYFFIKNIPVGENITITFINLSGQNLSTRVVNADSNIDVSELETGIYFVKMEDENGKLTVQKLIVL